MLNRVRVLDLGLIRAFVHVCDFGSITGAAPELGYSQPGLSQRIQTLERILGKRLLIRGPQGVRPTTAGNAVLPYARMLLAIADTMRDDLNRLDTEPPSLDVPDEQPESD
jgi:DNA-binding transcriptional LysR family regulator